MSDNRHSGLAKNSISFFTLGLTGVILLLSSFNMMEQQILELPEDLKSKFAYIPEGEVFMDGEKYKCAGFYMLKHELTNKEYNEFLESLKSIGEADAFTVAKRKGENWVGVVEQAEAYVQHYGSHESYDEYPVVNLSMKAAEMYCKWLQRKISPTFSDEYSVEVKLPSRVEWIRASRPKNMDDAFTWGGSFLISNTGDIMCNFKRLGAEHIYWDESTKSYQVKEDIKISKYSRQIKERSTGIKKVTAFNANKFGLYNMNGNVAELTADGKACGGSWNSTGYDVRNESYIDFKEPSPMIGFRPILVVTPKEQ